LTTPIEINLKWITALSPILADTRFGFFAFWTIKPVFLICRRSVEQSLIPEATAARTRQVLATAVTLGSRIRVSVVLIVAAVMVPHKLTRHCI
jgi:hypothetical protein